MLTFLQCCVDPFVRNYDLYIRSESYWREALLLQHLLQVFHTKLSPQRTLEVKARGAKRLAGRAPVRRVSADLHR
jgi:hypothetical protein